jgi:predicted O-methyltransferase YrrM
VTNKWNAVDDYIAAQLVPHDDALDDALEDSRAAGLPAINVSPPLGKLLNVLARSMGARSILEIGTLGGYSSIWLARALPADGRLVTLEMDANHARVAKKNIERAGLADLVEIRVGVALDTLPWILRDGPVPFDLVFIDADKENIPQYFEWSLKLTQPGSLIVVDNVVRDGGVLDASGTDPAIVGVRRFMDMVSSEPRVTATAIQTVGSKGYDGFAVLLVLG